MSVRHAQPLAANGAAVAASHLGGGARFINEDQALGIKVKLGVEPGLALAQDVGTVLLGRMPGLFLSVIR